MSERSAAERRDELVALFYKLRDCHDCPLSQSRTNLVFGTGNPDADLMFVGEAPGFHEDQQGKPFVGPAGQLLDRLLSEIGLERGDTFIANVLKCRPPQNRDPQPDEIAECKPHLYRQIELIEPRVICTLGNFSSKLLTSDQRGITKSHGRPRTVTLGRLAVCVYPIFHPAAALRSKPVLNTLREDFARIPALMAEFGPPQPVEDPSDAGSGPDGLRAGAQPAPQSQQLDLFG